MTILMQAATMKAHTATAMQDHPSSIVCAGDKKASAAPTCKHAMASELNAFGGMREEQKLAEFSSAKTGESSSAQLMWTRA